jgi:cytochrome oxidase Cu insertion factor (SCO1/SenC/PrrC family)
MREYNFTHFRFSHLAADAKGTWQLRGPQPGTVAPDFELNDADGRPWRLRQRRGKPVLLHFGSYT